MVEIDLSGKTAIVTGGSRGLGRQVALLLAEAGASVGVGYRSRSLEAEDTLAATLSAGTDSWLFGADLRDPKAPARLFAHAHETWGRIDILVANHGVWPPDSVALSEMSDPQWERTLGINLSSVFRLCREAGRCLEDDGRIVLVGSTAGQRGEAFHADYAVSKGAMSALVKSLCVELGPRGITVNCVAPGWIDTEMSAPAMADGGAREIAAQIPIGRVASARDVAGPVLFLCSDLARHITGEVMNVNGGAVLAG